MMGVSLADLRSVLLVVDASQSAASHWSMTLETAARLTERLSPGALEKIYVLGSGQSYPPHAFTGRKIPLPANGHSFIAPVIDRLRQDRRYIELAVIIGSGEVYDLADWLAFPWVERWLLVRSGAESLCPDGLAVTEVTGHELLEVDLGTATVSSVTSTHTESLSVVSPNVYDWQVDNCGFPSIYIPPLSAHWSLFPLTKYQLERYLCATPTYDDSWYKELLRLNGRLSLRQITEERYEQLFAAGLRSDEAEVLAQWAGGEMPDLAAWRTAYRWLATQPALLPPVRVARQLSPAARAIWYGLYAALEPPTLLGLSLTTGGFHEWVREGRQYRLLGKPRPAFHETLAHPLRGDPIRPIEPIQRVVHFGVRVMY